MKIPNLKNIQKHIDESPTLEAISSAASEFKIHIIAGSIPEKTEEGIYNTCFIFNNHGKIIGFHRKMHLFDIDIPRQNYF